MNLRTEDCSLHPRRSLSLAVLLSFVALITETLGSKATVSPIWVYRDNKIVNVPNNNYQNFSGNAISIKSEDLPNGISIKGQMIDEIKPAEFDLPLLTGVKDFSVIGDNAIRFENGTSLTVGLVSRSQSGSLAVKTAFTRHDLGTNLKLVTDFYATSGKGVGTYVQLLNNVTNNSLTLVVTDFKDLNLAISLPVQQATLGSLEMDDSKSTVVYGLAIGLNNGDKQIYSFGFDLQNPSVILNASWATRVLADWTPVSVTWALPGSAFVFNYKTQSKGKIVYYRTDWGSFGDLSAVEVYSYGVDNDVYISTLCGIELLIADPIKKSLYSYWIGPRSYTIEYKYLDYGVDTIVAMSCNVHGNLEVIAKAASGERKMIIFKLDSDNFGPYDVHSVTPVDSAVSTVASISPINYDGSLSPEIFLTMGFRLGADLQKDNLNFFEVYNGHPGVNNLGDETHVSSERMWDIINAKRLTELDLPLLYGLGTDDGHSYHKIPSRASEPGRGWVMVLAVRLWGLRGAGDRAGEVTAGRVLVTTMLNPKALIFGLVLLPAPADQAFLPKLLFFCLLVMGVSLVWGAAGQIAQGGQGGATRLQVIRRIASVWLAFVSITLIAGVLRAGGLG